MPKIVNLEGKKINRSKSKRGPIKEKTMIHNYSKAGLERDKINIDATME